MFCNSLKCNFYNKSNFVNEKVRKMSVNWEINFLYFGNIFIKYFHDKLRK